MIAKQLLAEDISMRIGPLKSEVSKLYDKLVQLEYLESLIQGSEHPKMEESLDSKSFRERNWFVEPKPVPQSPHQEDLAEPAIEKIKDIVAHSPEETDEINEILYDKEPPVEADVTADSDFEELNEPEKKIFQNPPNKARMIWKYLQNTIGKCPNLNVKQKPLQHPQTKKNQPNEQTASTSESPRKSH